MLKFETFSPEEQNELLAFCFSSPFEFLFDIFFLRIAMKMANDVAWKTNLTNHYNLVINMRVFVASNQCCSFRRRKRRRMNEWNKNNVISNAVDQIH